MSLNTTALYTPHMRSLTDWLVLAGVSIEIGDQPTTYKIAMPEILQASEPPQAAASPSTAATAPRPAQPALQIDRFNNLEELNKFCSTWKNMGLAKTAARAVPGHGAMNPAVMVISDIPDDSEDRQGQAFSSPANRMIRQAMTLAGLREEEIYFSYLSKWRTPAKRPLTNVERDVCAQILHQEIGFIQPRTILALGESTLRGLIPEVAPNIGKNLSKNEYKNQHLNKIIPVIASQKGEFLIKNALMKKTLWLSLLELAALLRTTD